MTTPLSLEEICAVLGCSKPAASMLRNGRYARPSSDLPGRYAALLRLAERLAGQAADPQQLCLACERQDCTGCRVAEL